MIDFNEGVSRELIVTAPDPAAAVALMRELAARGVTVRIVRPRTFAITETH